jgi:cytochrome P450
MLTNAYSLAGADTTATAFRTMILHIATNTPVRRKLLNQIDDADAQGLLSTPVKYEEIRKHVGYIELITKEALRMSDITCHVLLA